MPEQQVSPLHRAAWPDMFANLQAAYTELTQTRFELEQHMAEIGEIRDLFERVIESMSELLFLVDVSGHVLQVNQAASKLLGIEKSRILRCPLAEFFPAAKIPVTPWQLLERASGGKLTGLDIEVKTQSTAVVPLSVSCAVVRDRTGKITGLLIVARDITERKLADAVRQRAHAELEQRVEERTAALAAANRVLRAEIEERKRIESEREQLFKAVSQQREALRALAMRLAEVQEDERQQLARELHDKIGQNLSALGFNLNSARTRLSEATAEEKLVRSHLADSLALIDQMGEIIRDVMAELRPPVLDDYGLVDALEWYGDQFSARTGLAVHVQGKPLNPRLNPPLENALFRIAQEALTNVAKHAQATQVIISIEVVGSNICLSISDDGIGFEPATMSRTANRHHLGTLIMSERAKAVGGRCRVESIAGHGTCVIVEIAR